MKVICTSNYADESRSDVLVCENVSEFWAEKIMLALNQKYSGDQAVDYYKAVKNDYTLYEYDPR